MRLFLHKLFHWEYWPFQIVYIPIYFLWSFYALKARTIFFFNASNPKIRNGGFMAESKIEIYDLIPQKYYPKTIFIAENTEFQEVISLINKASIQLPFFAKPDIGLRGSAVKKINSLDDLKIYHEKSNFDYLIQDMIPYSNEVGIFYVRFPNEKKGKITGIGSKEYAIVEGNGTATIEQLIKQNPRYEMQIKQIKKEFGNRFDEVLEKGKKLNLIPYGNHARGAKFIDYNHLITDKLNETIENICKEIPHYYYGRLDIMYDSWDDLEQGKKFKLVEINGAGSEPIHIFDPKHSIFFAWKEIARHITYMYKISVQNHKLGFPYLSHKKGMRQYNIHIEQSRKIVNF